MVPLRVAGPRPLRWLVLAALACTLAGCEGVESAATASSASTPARSPADLRDSALRSARVWIEPTVPIAQVNFAVNPESLDNFRPDADVGCRFSPTPVGGTTPKFNCELDGGDTVKVKYGKTNPEIYTEVAATRLLSALGFPTDSMFVVRSVHCAGCPNFPFHALRCVAKFGFEKPCFGGGLDYSDVVTFNPARIERKLPGDTIEAIEDQGWAWYELETIDPAAGGSTLAEVDALRLMAVMLAHWDNKAENQRLICPAGQRQPDGRCAQPLAIVQDVGGTFGPAKLELTNWKQTPVWTDATTCTVSMKNLPFGGGTFLERRISEAGRTFALGLLEQLSESQLVDLFKTSGMTDYDQIAGSGRDPKAWAAAFADKVRQIRDAGPCQ